MGGRRPSKERVPCPRADGDGESSYIYGDDGTYLIRISPSRDKARLRWRVDAYYKGYRESTRTCTTFRYQSDAEGCASALWKDYVVASIQPQRPHRQLWVA